MHILELRAMRGPNYWSNYRKKLIVAKLDIGWLENFPTNRIDGFQERLENLLPGMIEHRCSEEERGGFFERVRKGTWMGHIVEHIALEIQSLAGMECGFGRTRSTAVNGVYHVIFEYVFEEAGKKAAYASVEIANALVKGKNFDLEPVLQQLRKTGDAKRFGPSTQSLVDEAERRNIPWKRMDEHSMVRFGYGKYQKRIKATIAENTCSLGVDLVSNKSETKRLLSEACIPVPNGKIISDLDELENALHFCGFPVVIKPVDGNHGRGVTTRINSFEEAEIAFEKAGSISRKVIVERFIEGYDFRLLVINYKLVAAAKRIPPCITGDGIKTVQQLIDLLNDDPRRGEGHENLMTKIKMDDSTETILRQNDLKPDDILPLNKTLYLKDTANISTGGSATDVTDLVHPSFAHMSERVSRITGLDICGIDIIAKNILEPFTIDNGAVIEVNAAPGFRMHLSPSSGLPRNVAAHVLDMLFPEDSKSRIPIIAITGTNGKTTTSRLCAHMAATAGYKTGFTTTDGIYLNGELIQKGDCTGPQSSSIILNDPTTEFAVLECARGGILRSGLAFDKCDISIITNITEDHLGLGGIHTLTQMAEVKAVVARCTAPQGYAILNSEDDLVYAIKRKVDCNIALFGLSENERIIRHCRNGGLAAFIQEDHVVIRHGEWITRLAHLNEIPITFNGRAEFMVKNVLPSVLAGMISNFGIDVIRKSLSSFIPSAEYTPGRLNFFAFGSVNVLVDYAHNKDGYLELKKFLEKTPAAYRIGIIAATGDRREEDMRNAGRFAAEMFNEIVIRHDKDLRGCPVEKSNALLMEGIKSIDPSIPVSVISDEIDALTQMITRSQPGSLIVLCADQVTSVLSYLTQHEKTLRNEVDYQILIAS